MPSATSSSCVGAGFVMSGGIIMLGGFVLLDLLQAKSPPKTKAKPDKSAWSLIRLPSATPKGSYVRKRANLPVL